MYITVLSFGLVKMCQNLVFKLLLKWWWWSLEPHYTRLTLLKQVKSFWKMVDSKKL